MIEKNKSLLIKRILCIIFICILLGITTYIYIRYGRMLWTFFSDIDNLKAWINRFGSYGNIAFIAIRSLQTVVKIIPAEPLEIGSGLAFGIWGGMFSCLLGNIIGSLVILFLTRKFGTKVINLFFKENKLNSMAFLRNKQKRRLLLLIIYLIPGTPKDGITYFVGLTDINLVEFMIMTSFARIPSILSSTICGALLGEKNFALAIGVFAATTVLSIGGALVYKKISEKYGKKHGAVAFSEEQKE